MRLPVSPRGDIVVHLGGFETPTRRSSVFRSTVLSYRWIIEILLFLNQKEDCRVAVRTSLVRRVGVEPTHTTVSEWLTDTNRLLPPDKNFKIHFSNVV